MNRLFIVLSSFIISISCVFAHESNISSWKKLRDLQTVKQNLDYSCGAASVATIFTYFYNRPTLESEVLEKIDSDTAATFRNLSEVIEDFGYASKAIITDLNTIKKLKIPAIAHIKYNGEEHFTVIRSVANNYIYLSDSSLGNKVLSEKQFLSVWDYDNTNTGKILLILPKLKEQEVKVNYKFTQPIINYSDISILTFQYQNGIN